MTDEDRVAVARARRNIDERFHEKAVVAGLEIISSRGDEYLGARIALSDAHLPDVLANDGESRLEADELAYWNEVARGAQQAIDDALVAVLASDSLHPNHLRELYRSLGAMRGS